MKKDKAFQPDNNNDPDDEFDRLMDEFLKSEMDEDDPFGDDQAEKEDPCLTDEELKQAFGDSVSLFSYRFHCRADNDPSEHIVEGLEESIKLQDNIFVHIDLEVPYPHEEKDLRVEVTTASKQLKFECSWNTDSIAMFRDGNHLHFKTFRFFDILTFEYELHANDTDELVMSLFKEGHKIKEARVTLTGPWPQNTSSYQGGDTLESKLESVRNLPGMENFKRRIEEMAVRCKVNKQREDAGLPVIKPMVNTILAGNIGTGKETCVNVLADVYCSLGLIYSCEVRTINVSSLLAETVNGSSQNMKKTIEDMTAGVLWFEDAHVLYKADYKSYDCEPQIIRALIDTLSSVKDRSGWMMVLSGYEEGLENLLAANPELKGFFSSPIYIDNYKKGDLFRLIDPICSEYELKLTDDARHKLEMYIMHKQNHSGAGIENSELIRRIFNEHIVPSMFGRLDKIEEPSKDEMCLVEIQDIPELNSNQSDGMDQLNALIGLGGLKQKMNDYLNVIRLTNMRMEKGLPTKMPRLHMAFLGNPGTGKTTVAKIIGKIFASWGILSTGHVIRTEKSQLVGQYIGETEFKMRNLLARARGNILFIDEAYQLYIEGYERDHGRIVMDSLLTELGNDDSDLVVILAGYTAPMKKLLESNEGIESRFPNVFNFEDYTTDELMAIGDIMIKEQGLELSDGARANMRAILEEESLKPSARFGNGRFVSNLIQNQILATMGSRLATVNNPTKEQLVTIQPEDVVVGKAHKDVVFDDTAIDSALASLDALAGLSTVKKAIHNFVQSARYLHSIGEPYVGKGLLSWRFIGKSGTGKSTVAEIMARILKGMHLIANSNIVQVKAERLFMGDRTISYEVLKDAVKKSCNGLILIDADETKFGMNMDGYGRLVEQIRLKMEELTIESGGECALILAELDAPNKTVAEQLTDSGIYEFDHTLVFKDFTPDELYEILCNCLKKFNITFSPAAENHIKKYITTLSSSYEANARTMKLMSRTIHQQVILRESGLTRRPKVHQVQLADIETFKWNSRKGRIGY